MLVKNPKFVISAVRPEQYPKAPSPRKVTLEGRVTEVRLAHL